MIGDPKKVAVGIIAKLHPKEDADEPAMDDGVDDGMAEKHSIAQELIHAVHAGDAGAVVDAFEAMFQACDKEPHEEGPHIEDEMGE
jgi:hypothetical protein